MRDISLRIDAQQEGIDFIRQNRVPNIEPEKESGDGYKGRANYTKLGRSSSGQSGPTVYKNPRFGKGTEFT